MRFAPHRPDRRARGFVHADAQRYERSFAENAIRSDFERIWSAAQAAKAEGSLWHGPDDQWFQGDKALWEAFVAHVRCRLCLEIGSGPFGYLGPAWWIERRAVIDPLVDFYRAAELEVAGGTFFGEGVETYAVAAEELVDGLVGAVGGCVVCRNALDHTEDPLAVLWNIAHYALPGCFFLLWTDIWHLAGPNEGHRNITRCPEVLDRLLEGLGFEILKRGAAVRRADEYLEFGRLARKCS
jgi:hypothetical protein